LHKKLPSTRCAVVAGEQFFDPCRALVLDEGWFWLAGFQMVLAGDHGWHRGVEPRYLSQLIDDGPCAGVAA
jgi:hypothetical protein